MSKQIEITESLTEIEKYEIITYYFFLNKSKHLLPILKNNKFENKTKILKYFSNLVWKYVPYATGKDKYIQVEPKGYSKEGQREFIKKCLDKNYIEIKEVMKCLVLENHHDPFYHFTRLNNKHNVDFNHFNIKIITNSPDNSSTLKNSEQHTKDIII